jgi:hypothetical protein
MEAGEIMIVTAKIKGLFNSFFRGLGLFTVAATAATVVASLASGEAHAVSVTNRDDKEQKIQIVEGDVKKDHTLKPAAVLDGVCLKGCVIRLNENDNDEYELDGTEVVTIEDGYLYYDGPDAPPAPAPGAAAPAAPTPAPAPKAP